MKKYFFGLVLVSAFFCASVGTSIAASGHLVVMNLSGTDIQLGDDVGGWTEIPRMGRYSVKFFESQSVAASGVRKFETFIKFAGNTAPIMSTSTDEYPRTLLGCVVFRMDGVPCYKLYSYNYKDDGANFFGQMDTDAQVAFMRARLIILAALMGLGHLDISASFYAMNEAIDSVIINEIACRELVRIYLTALSLASLTVQAD